MFTPLWISNGNKPIMNLNIFMICGLFHQISFWPFFQQFFCVFGVFIMCALAPSVALKCQNQSWRSGTINKHLCQLDRELLLFLWTRTRKKVPREIAGRTISVIYYCLIFDNFWCLKKQRMASIGPAYLLKSTFS